MKNKLNNSRKKQIEKIFKESEVLVLAESMNDNIKIIAEGHLNLERGIAGLKDELGEFRREADERFARMGERFNQADERFGRMEKKFGEFDVNQKITLEYLSRIDDESRT